MSWIFLDGCFILKSKVLTPYWMVLQISCCNIVLKEKFLITGKDVDLTFPPPLPQICMLNTAIIGEWKDKTFELQGVADDLSLIELSYILVATLLGKQFVAYYFTFFSHLVFAIHSW